MSEECTCSKCGHTFVPSLSFDFYPDPTPGNPNAGLCESCMMKEAFKPKPSPVPVPGDYETSVCRRGQGEATCSFLAIGAVGPDRVGPTCLKGSSMEVNIGERLRNNTMRSKGNNCSGPPDFIKK